MTSPIYQHAALGGTFDHFHLGHQALLSDACSLAHRVTIGLTTPKLSQHKIHASSIQDYNSRQQAITDWLDSQGWLQKTNIIPLSDRFGPTLSDRSIDLIIVTPHTLEGAKEINSSRTEIALPPLTIHTTQLVQDDEGGFISSTKIRLGQINRSGVVYQRLFDKPITLSTKLKHIMSQPQGKVSLDLTVLQKWFTPNTILVGDIVSEYAFKNELPFHAAIIDHHSARQAYEINLGTFVPSQELTASNEAGTIQPEAVEAISSLLQQAGSLLHINGEEDLLALPVVLLSPLHFQVLYGQPDAGIVNLQVSESTKAKYYALLYNHHPSDAYFVHESSSQRLFS